MTGFRTLVTPRVDFITKYLFTIMKLNSLALNENFLNLMAVPLHPRMQNHIGGYFVTIHHILNAFGKKIDLSAG